MRRLRIINFQLFLILAITPLIFLPQLSDRFYYPKILFVYIVLGAIFYNIWFIPKKKSIHLSNNELVILIYLLLVVVSACFADDISRSIWGSLGREEGIIAITSYIMLYNIARNYYRNKKLYIQLLLVTSLLVSIYGILQFYDLDPIARDYLRISWSGRAFSTIGNPNFLGTYLILMLPISLFKFFRESNLIFLFNSAVIYLCLLLTFTRSSLLGFAVIMAFIIVFVVKKKKYIKKCILLLVVFSLVTVFVDIESNGRLYGRVLSIGKDAQILLEKGADYEKVGANRIFIWLKTITLITESPWVGYGVENLENVFVEKYSDEMIDIFGKVYLVDRAHNEYLHIAVSSGLPALILYLIFIILCLKKGYELVKKDIRYLPYLSAISAYLVQAFFNISVVSVSYIFWIFLGVINNETVFDEE